jgi:hypothetical protein
MMRKVLPLTALILGLSGGVALADRDNHRRDDRRHESARDHRGGRDRVVIRDRGNWRGGSRVIVRNEPRHNYYRHNNHNYRHDNYRHVVRRPIYVSRPVIRHRYYNYYQRPALIVENYGAQPGYYWVRGSWSWTGYEWIWQPGHYEPDPNYVDPSYGYYDGY